MRNRAKCKLCSSIIESFHPTDLVMCKCGEISVNDGAGMRCSADNWNNFLRVDDEGNEIVVSIARSFSDDKEAAAIAPIPASRPTKKELLDMLDEMVKNIEALPQNAMSQPITHYDFASALLLLSSILRAD